MLSSTEDGENGCLLGGTDRVTFTGADGRQNLDMTLTISGVGTLDDDDDPQCNYTAEIKIHNGGQGWQEGDIVEFEIKEKKYKVVVQEVERIWSSVGQMLIPPQTPADGSVIKAQEILEGLETVIEAEGSNVRSLVMVCTSHTLTLSKSSPSQHQKVS